MMNETRYRVIQSGSPMHTHTHTGASSSHVYVLHACRMAEWAREKAWLKAYRPNCTLTEDFTASAKLEVYFWPRNFGKFSGKFKITL